MKTKYDVKLLNGSKQEVTYEGIETVTLPAADGSGVKTFTAGEPLDEMTITPDFSGGDQTVEAPEGYAMRSATIAKPENLTPENIAKGVEIAGVVGEAQGTVQSDWAQNDEAQAGFVKNRPGAYDVVLPELDFTFDGQLEGKESVSFDIDENTSLTFVRVGDPVEDIQRLYGASARVRIENLELEDETLTGFAYNSTYGTYVVFAGSPYNFDLIVGETYRITWDGETYECIVQDAGAILGDGYVALGNCTKYSLKGNDEPFAIVSASGLNPGYAALSDTEEGGSHTVAIARVAEQSTTLSADDIEDVSIIVETYPTDTVYLIGEAVMSILVQTDLGLLFSVMTGTEQPSQVVSPGLYFVVQTYSSQIMYVDWVNAPERLTAVEIPEKYTEAKVNKLGGYWCDGITLEWDGNTDGLGRLGETDLYRISEQVIPATLPVTLTGTTESGLRDMKFDSMSYIGSDSNPLSVFGIVQSNMPLLYVVYADQLAEGIAIKRGIYAFAGEVDGVSGYISKITVASGWAKWPEVLAGGDASYNEQIEDIQTNVSTLQTDVSTLQTDVSTLQTDVSTLQTNVSTLSNESVRYKHEKRDGMTGLILEYAGGKYIRGTWDKRLYVSDDGIWWDTVETDDIVSWNTYVYHCNLAYGNGVFVYTRHIDKYPGWSTDGKSWVFPIKSCPIVTGSVAFGGGKFVALEATNFSGKIIYSDDGVNWSAATLPAAMRCYSLAYENGRFVILASDGSFFNVVALYSDNAVDWKSTTVNENNTRLPYYIASGAGRFVGVFQGETSLNIVYSEDGVTWNYASTSDAIMYSGDIIGLVYNGERFFLAFSGSDGRGFGMWSDDGITWDVQQKFIDIDGENDPNGEGICAAGGKLVLSNSYNSDLWESVDGVNWSGKAEKLVDDDGNNIAPNIGTILGVDKIAVEAQEYTDKKTAALGDKFVIINSSTEGSSKRFAITVDDTGVLRTTEITA